MKFYNYTAYEKYTGESHLFEVFHREIKGAAPFVIMLDGTFLSTAEIGTEIGEEIEDTIKWFGWSRTNPIFA